MKRITINGKEYILYSADEHTELNIHPHLVEATTGKIPNGKQLSLLKAYLRANGVTPVDNANTHWCVEAAIKLDASAAVIPEATETRHQEKKALEAPPYLPLTVANIEEQDTLVKESNNYGKENLIIHDVLNAFPENTDVNTVAMKIGVIDVTNSTNLAKYKSKLSLYDVSKLIVDIPDFDKRVAAGDPELVNIIARNTGAINLFSFASKYCTYHNVEVYERDDYSIFDGIVQKSLPHYLTGVTAHKIDTWRTSYDYVSFNDCIGKLLDDNDIHIPFRRRKFDHFLWYANR